MNQRSGGHHLHYQSINTEVNNLTTVDGEILFYTAFKKKKISTVQCCYNMVNISQITLCFECIDDLAKTAVTS